MSHASSRFFVLVDHHFVLVFSSFFERIPDEQIRVVAQKLRYHALVLQRRSSFPAAAKAAAFKPAAAKAAAATKGVVRVGVRESAVLVFQLVRFLATSSRHDDDDDDDDFFAPPLLLFRH